MILQYFKSRGLWRPSWVVPRMCLCLTAVSIAFYTSRCFWGQLVKCRHCVHYELSIEQCSPSSLLLCWEHLMKRLLLLLYVGPSSSLYLEEAYELTTSATNTSSLQRCFVSRYQSLSSPCRSRLSHYYPSKYHGRCLLVGESAFESWGFVVNFQHFFLHFPKAIIFVSFFKYY